MDILSNQQSATPKGIVRYTHEREAAIVNDDFAALPLRATNVNGKWWVTTPNNLLQPLKKSVSKHLNTK